VLPVVPFKIPGPSGGTVIDDAAPATITPVRAMVRSVDLMAPYFNHLDSLKAVHTTLARTGSEAPVTDEPDLGTPAWANTRTDFLTT
jgi:hypothetical protein